MKADKRVKELIKAAKRIPFYEYRRTYFKTFPYQNEEWHYVVFTTLPVHTQVDEEEEDDSSFLVTITVAGETFVNFTAVSREWGFESCFGRDMDRHLRYGYRNEWRDLLLSICTALQQGA